MKNVFIPSDVDDTVPVDLEDVMPLLSFLAPVWYQLIFHILRHIVRSFHARVILVGYPNTVGANFASIGLAFEAASLL